jgi:uncharacterized cofD-like protein
MAAKNVVVIGGGPGTDLTLRGLKHYTTHLTALVSTFGSGPHDPAWDPGGPARDADDVRSSLLALGADPATTQIMERLFAYRVATGGPPGLTFGNLFLAALTDIMGAADLALQAAAQVLNVQGRVLPLTLAAGPLVADLLDGREVIIGTPGDLPAAVAGTGLRDLRLPAPAPALRAACETLAGADVIVLGPTDLYFNLLAPLQLDGLRAAITASPAVKIFVCNLLTHPHTTAGWTASRYIRRLLSALGGPGGLDYVIVNSAPLAAAALERQAAQGRFPVVFDLDECLALALNIIVRPVANADTLTHDPEKLARTILFLGGERAGRRTTPPAAHATPTVALTPTGAPT